MTLTPKQKRNLIQIAPFGVMWFIFSFIYIFIEHGVLGDSTHYPTTGNPYKFSPFLTAIVATVSGLMIGSFEVFVLRDFFRKRNFVKKMIVKTLVYLIVIIVFLVGSNVISNSIEHSYNILDSALWDNTGNFVFSFAFISVSLYIAALLFICLFYTEVSDNIGQGVLLNFLKGKYHNPVEEERIFMFSDMKSSTTIAEKMGHVQYFEMLKEYYSDQSDAIINNAGEIYKYVGDEIIITWTLKEGIESNRCINCFFDMKKSLEKKKDHYIKKYGVFPTFKAGIHCGWVTTGEIGEVKKEITFSGDVMNATARIQSLCKEYDQDLIISAELMKKIENSKDLKSSKLGEVELRGKNKRVELIAIET